MTNVVKMRGWHSFLLMEWIGLEFEGEAAEQRLVCARYYAETFPYTAAGRYAQRVIEANT